MTVLFPNIAGVQAKPMRGSKSLPTIEAIIERAAGSALIGEFDSTGGEIVVGLLVVGLDPRSKNLIAQTEIQGQAFRHPPSVFRVEADDVVGLSPGFAGADSATDLIRKAEDEICRAVIRYRWWRYRWYCCEPGHQSP